jgi:hypothetical protein
MDETQRDGARRRALDELILTAAVPSDGAYLGIAGDAGVSPIDVRSFILRGPETVSDPGALARIRTAVDKALQEAGQ